MQESLRELSGAIIPQGCESKNGKGSGNLLAPASTSLDATRILGSSDSGGKKALDAARAWLKRFGSQLPEIMTAD